MQLYLKHTESAALLKHTESAAVSKTYFCTESAALLKHTKSATLIKRTESADLLIHTESEALIKAYSMCIFSNTGPVNTQGFCVEMFLMRHIYFHSCIHTDY